MTASELERLRSILKSFGIHLALVLTLFVIWKRSPSEEKKPDLIAVEFPSDQRQSPQSVRQKGSISSASRERAPRVTLNDLGLRFDYSQRVTPPELGEMSTDLQKPAIEQDLSGGWDLLNPDPKRARFNQYVYQVVQRWLDQESLRNRLQLTGTVKVRIWFSDEGEYLETRTQYRAVDPDFEKIVSRALRYAFQQPVPKPYLFTDQTFYIDREVYVRPY